MKKINTGQVKKGLSGHKTFAAAKVVKKNDICKFICKIRQKGEKTYNYLHMSKKSSKFARKFD